jgi:hypothetical protein
VVELVDALLVVLALVLVVALDVLLVVLVAVVPPPPPDPVSSPQQISVEPVTVKISSDRRRPDEIRI